MPLPPSLVVVWGNCQAEPIASLLAAPLSEVGLEVARLPPVYEMDATDVARLHGEVLPRTAVLISQPIRDEYRVAGCGTAQLAQQLPMGGRLVTFPITYDSSAFPYQVRAHDGDGARIDAPLTDYHDLRAIVAAERGLSIEEAVDWWPSPTEEMVRENARRSKAELQRREQALDVHTSDLLDHPAMFTVSHPTNTTLAEIAARIARTLHLPIDDIVAPEREYLGERRAPVEPAVVDALGWPKSAGRREWVVAKKSFPLPEILAVQIGFYREHPGIARDARTRFADRLALVDL